MSVPDGAAGLTAVFECIGRASWTVADVGLRYLVLETSSQDHVDNQHGLTSSLDIQTAQRRSHSAKLPALDAR